MPGRQQKPWKPSCRSPATARPSWWRNPKRWWEKRSKSTRHWKPKDLKLVETDLGEYIVQLRGEPPAHIITPAVHLSRSRSGPDIPGKAGRRIHGRYSNINRDCQESAEAGLPGGGYRHFGGQFRHRRKRRAVPADERGEWADGHDPAARCTLP